MSGASGFCLRTKRHINHPNEGVCITKRGMLMDGWIAQRGSGIILFMKFNQSFMTVETLRYDVELDSCSGQGNYRCTQGRLGDIEQE